MKYLPYIISLSLSGGFIAEALPLPSAANSLAVQSCTGRTIYIELDPNNKSPLPPPHKLKPCHAVCCSDEMDMDDEGEGAEL